MGDAIGYTHITEALVSEIADADYTSLDTETTGLLFDSRVLGISIAWVKGEGEVKSLYLNLGHLRSLFYPRQSKEDAQAIVRAIMQTKRVYFCNAPFDLERLARWDLLPQWPKPGQLIDVQPTARMAFPFAYKESISLAHLTDRFAGGFPPAAKEMKKMRNRLAELPAERVESYAKADAECTLRVGLRLQEEMDKVYDSKIVKSLLEKEARFLMLLTRMQMRGILLDVEYITAKAEQLKMDKDRTALRLYEAGLENPGSTKQVAALLSKDHVLPRTAKGNPCVNSKALKWLGGPLVKDILHWRGLNKAISTWLDGFLGLTAEDGRIHPRFYAAGTISGRISCRKPNLQAIPLEDRGGAFGAMMGIFKAPPESTIWAFDYSQAEMRLASMYAASDKMALVFDSGEDVHRATAQEMWPKEDIGKRYRHLAKQANFTMIYGGGAHALAENTGIKEDEAKQLLKQHREAFPTLAKMMKLATKTWLEKKYLRLLSGRYRWLGKGEEERVYKAYNQLIQGGVAEAMKTAMLDVDEYLRTQDLGHVLLQVHDSIEAEIRTDAPPGTKMAVKCTMAEAVPKWLRERTSPHITLKVESEQWTH